jgi:hypothetical protein
MKPTFINNMVINSSFDPHVPDHICIHIGLSHYGAGLVLQLVYYTVIASSTETPEMKMFKIRSHVRGKMVKTSEMKMFKIRSCRGQNGKNT